MRIMFNLNSTIQDGEVIQLPMVSISQLEVDDNVAESITQAINAVRDLWTAAQALIDEKAAMRGQQK